MNKICKVALDNSTGLPSFSVDRLCDKKMLLRLFYLAFSDKIIEIRSF
jgi:hypothetical protein